MRSLLKGSLLLAGLLLSVVAGLTAASAAEFRIGYNRVWTTPALLIAKAQGLFEQRGVTVRWVGKACSGDLHPPGAPRRGPREGQLSTPEGVSASRCFTARCSRTVCRLRKKWCVE